VFLRPLVGHTQERTIAGAVGFLFNFGYLLTSYKYAATEDYDICYTMQQCVQCLRMIGYAMDYMDGVPAKKKSPSPSPSSTPSSDKSSSSSPSSTGEVLEKAAVQSKTPAVVREKTPISFGRDIALEEVPSLLGT